MKKYALLVLRNNANRVLAETTANSDAEAIAFFNSYVTVTYSGEGEERLNLDQNGYRKSGEITYCIAQYLRA